ncbi:uncharacterized protein LOC131316486 [Rhododendron vialii]|uniref:uncharacterized protein LOC131316486 n=1 Tax=Rhododendron vialii TaxID=182163 RepID=UPI00265EFB61|nr:uncharacterized protein LOC131316486 [Rhododendron vialii]XP_058201856.1 uncharacterized protein LOC131316486 [Rhododendron vialii]
MPDLRWEISARDRTSARAIVDIPRLPRPEMNFPAQIKREWAELAIMKMLGMHKLLRNCAKGKTLQTRLAPEPAITPVVEPSQVQTHRATRSQSQVVTRPLAPRVSQVGSRQFELRPRPGAQRQPEPEESEESGEPDEPEESLGTSDLDTNSGLPDPPTGDSDGDDDDESSEEEDPPQKKSRHD